MAKLLQGTPRVSRQPVPDDLFLRPHSPALSTSARLVWSALLPSLGPRAPRRQFFNPSSMLPRETLWTFILSRLGPTGDAQAWAWPILPQPETGLARLCQVSWDCECPGKVAETTAVGLIDVDEEGHSDGVLAERVQSPDM